MSEPYNSVVVVVDTDKYLDSVRDFKGLREHWNVSEVKLLASAKSQFPEFAKAFEKGTPPLCLITVDRTAGAQFVSGELRRCRRKIRAFAYLLDERGDEMIVLTMFPTILGYGRGPTGDTSFYLLKQDRDDGTCTLSFYDWYAQTLKKPLSEGTMFTLNNKGDTVRVTKVIDDMCEICMDNVTQHAFGVCGHSMCEGCLKNLNDNKCPYSRVEWDSALIYSIAIDRNE